MRTVGIVGNFDVPTYLAAVAASVAGWMPKVIVRSDEPVTDDVFMVEQWCGIPGMAPIEVGGPGGNFDSTYTNLTDIGVWDGFFRGILGEEVNTPDFIYSKLLNPDSEFSAFIFTGSRKVSCRGSGCHLPSSYCWARTMPADRAAKAEWREGMPMNPWTRWRRDSMNSIQTYFNKKPPLEGLTEIEVPQFGGACECFNLCEDTGHFKAIGEMGRWQGMRQDRRKIYQEAQDFLAGI